MATGSGASSNIPSQLIDLESRLAQPPVIYNVGKVKKQILREKLQAANLTPSNRNLSKLTQQLKNMKVQKLQELIQLIQIKSKGSISPLCAFFNLCAMLLKLVRKKLVNKV